MEITGEDGSKVQIKPFSNTVFGRGSGCITTDRTVSRCHVLFWLKDSSNGTETEPRACFDVIGKNPIWVRSGKSGKLKAFRRNEKGEVTVGDWFYIGGGQSQQPVRFAVKRINEQEAEKEMMEAGESSEWSSGGELESVDVSSIDPVKEFGFLVIGHEFDQYPKEKIREMKNWDWFLEEPRKDSDGDDEVTDKRKKNGMRRRRGKATKNDDDEDEWTGESEEDKEVIAKVKKMQKPTYSTRSKDHDKQQIGRKGGRSLVQKKSIPAKAEESEDEDDPTLGGFLLDDGDEESTPPKRFFGHFVESKKPHVKEVVANLTDESPDSPRLAGFVLDMFCTCMIEVADEFKVPSYLFFTSGAAFLGFMLRVQALHDEENTTITELKDSDAVLEVPGLVNSVPAKVWPSVVFNKEWAEVLNQQARTFRGTKGIMVNTFEELESHAVRSFSDGKSKTPPLYPMGPILNIKGENYDLGEGGADKKADIMAWLDDQPESSVVFLCFGSWGSFGEDQVKEIACALEQSGHRFLWSLRRPPSKDTFEKPSDYEDPTEVLPEGFMDRTANIGKVIGWAPQIAVLAHPAIGGFVSHCGWNSTLESIWFGVPIATWPMYAEQQFNAFELVVELGLAVEIKMDYRKDILMENPTVVNAEEIERGIRCLMEHNSEMRKRVKEMSEKARKALSDGGSSFSSMGRLIDDFLDNIA